MVQTNDPNKTFIGTLNLKEISKKRLKIKSYLEKPSLKNNVLTFPVGFYQNSHDNGIVECDQFGTIYLMGEFPIIVSKNFKNGIEKIIIEDYSDTFEWNPVNKTWDRRNI